MVMQSKELKVSKDAQTKTLIMRAWRERFTDVQWGIHVRSLLDSPSCDGSLIANCILQQALGGPGPNSLVLSYLMHSIYSQIISSCAVLKSISKYDGLHKPYCVASLLDLLDNIKERVILNDSEKMEDCMELAFSLASVVHWLLTCMYSSLENLSDLSINDVPVDIEDSKIVLKCRNLIEYFLTEPFISGLIQCAVLENDEIFQNIKKMSGEVAKFETGHHHQDIVLVTGLVEKIGRRVACNSSSKILSLSKSVDTRQVIVGSPAIQTTAIVAALFRASEDVGSIANDLKIIKDLKGLTNVQIFCDVMHSAAVLLIDCLSTPSEIQVLGSVFLVLPNFIQSLSSTINASPEDFIQGLNLFLENDSVLETTDTKLGCYTLNILLTRFQELNIITEAAKMQILEKKPQHTLPTNHSSNNALLLFKTETNISQIFTSLDGVIDFTKNQEAMLVTLYDMLGDNLDLILTTAVCTKKLKILSLKLLKLNQASRQVNGEAGKASATRAMIFDITFLILCVIGQTYGSEENFPTDEQDNFFIDWHSECMVENNSVKNPELIVNRCDQNKVEMLINQYLQGDTELKTSLVFWHELCTNAVGVVRDILFAWEAESANFTDVKKLLDVFRLKVCSLPVCISAWLCSHIQVSPEEQSGKARYILNQFLTPANSAVEEEHFQERYVVMSRVITKMLNCVQPQSEAASPISNCSIESKPISALYKKCFESMQLKGIVDIETMLSFKSLLTMNGSHYFVQGLINEMMENQSSADLIQWSEMLYGIFHINLHECTAALLRVVIPSLLYYWNRDSNFVEPQILALASLSVDCIVSYYLHATMLNNTEDEGEPSSKRRKLLKIDAKQEKLKELEFIMQELFGEFDKILKSSCDARPQAIFILRLLEQLSLKSVHLSLLTSLPNSVITNLMSLMSDDMDPSMLLGWYALEDKSARANCVLAICNLKHLQNVSTHCCGGMN